MKTISTVSHYQAILASKSLDNLVLIDSRVKEYQSLIAGIKPGMIPIVLRNDEDGIVQITAILAEYPDLKTIHIVSHGSPGSLQLGKTRLSLKTIEKYRPHTVFIESQDANGNFGVPTAVFIDVIDFPENAEITKGSDEAELLKGTRAEEVIYGLGGDDTIAGRLGDDLIFGNAGDDLLRGDDNLVLPTGKDGGNDLIYGGDGDDFLDGKGGDDTLYGEDGEDYLLGNVGDDFISGGNGNDTLVGDDLYSPQGNDLFVLASEGTDVILDFTVEYDLIELPAEITFGQLSITQDRQDTLIDIDDMTLVVLRDVDATTITQSSFVSV